MGGKGDAKRKWGGEDLPSQKVSHAPEKIRGLSRPAGNEGSERWFARSDAGKVPRTDRHLLRSGPERE